jgi:hypothetical protein
MTEISPAGRVNETSFQITWDPNDLVSPSTLISTPTAAPHPWFSAIHFIENEQVARRLRAEISVVKGARAVPIGKKLRLRR